MLHIRALSKNYGNNLALNSFDFTMSKGEIVGLVGPNGSGKTTLLNILTGMIKPSSGIFSVDKKLSIGMSMSRKGFFNDMSTFHNISLYASLMDAKKTDVKSIMDHFDIDFPDVQFRKLSAGMKQKVSLVLAFIKKNDLIFLDEPSNHLDIDSIIKLRHLITKLNQSGTSFIITSHIFSDLEKVCDRILFLKRGKLCHNAKKSEIIDQYETLENAYLKILK